MAPIPAPSPTALTGYSAPNAAAGGGQQFQASGPCSGTAFTHTQDLTIFYEIVSIPQQCRYLVTVNYKCKRFKTYSYGKRRRFTYPSSQLARYRAQPEVEQQIVLLQQMQDRLMS